MSVMRSKIDSTHKWYQSIWLNEIIFSEKHYTLCVDNILVSIARRVADFFFIGGVIYWHSLIKSAFHLEHG